MSGPLTGMLPGTGRERDPLGGTSYARPHPRALVPPYDPQANRLPSDPHHPRAVIDVPPGCLAVELANAGRTSASGHHRPGELAVLPEAEALDLIRQGRAREVRTG